MPNLCHSPSYGRVSCSEGGPVGAFCPGPPLPGQVAGPPHAAPDHLLTTHQQGPDLPGARGGASAPQATPGRPAHWPRVGQRRAGPGLSSAEAAGPSSPGPAWFSVASASWGTGPRLRRELEWGEEVRAGKGMSWARWPQRVARPLHRVGRCPPALPPAPPRRECPTWDWARTGWGRFCLLMPHRVLPPLHPHLVRAEGRAHWSCLSCK
uniref:Uncharacterized protein n=1 Tax=Myotis myotis TaxID=51298 RepID=A0A7J7ZX38_MYOMY|nr:hypothetical protein mMyoMyo1_009571 [Myotis myotis]